MVIEISLSLMAAALVLLVVILIRVSYRAEKTVRLLHGQVQEFSAEAFKLLHNLDTFIRSDLHNASEETTALMKKINQLKLLNLIGSNDSSSKSETIPLIIKWIASSVHILQITRERLWKKNSMIQKR